MFGKHILPQRDQQINLLIALKHNNFYTILFVDNVNNNTNTLKLRMFKEGAARR